MIEEFLDSGRLVLVGSDRLDDSDARALQRAAGHGKVRRLRRGVYVNEEQWELMSSVERYRRRVDAVSATRRRAVVFGYEPAAVLLGMQVSGVGTTPVHVIVPRSSPAHSRNGVVMHRHDLRDDEVVEVGGLLVTSPIRTAVDLARARSFRDAVIALDFLVNPRRAGRVGVVTRELLEDALGASSTKRGAVRAGRAIGFARNGAANPGESVSRVVIHQLGFPAPDLQVRHSNPRGGNYFTDTEWPEFRLIGEFDGKGKYLKAEYLNGMTPGEAVYEEKIREDHLRAEGNGLVRWGWNELRNPHLLERILVRAGLPRGSVASLPSAMTGRPPRGSRDDP